MTSRTPARPYGPGPHDAESDTAPLDVDADRDNSDYFGAQGDRGRTDRDGIRSLRDLQEESGDEEEVDDTFRIDWRSASEAGVDLDRPDGPETLLG